MWHPVAKIIFAASRECSPNNFDWSLTFGLSIYSMVTISPSFKIERRAASTTNSLNVNVDRRSDNSFLVDLADDLLSFFERIFGWQSLNFIFNPDGCCDGSRDRIRSVSDRFIACSFPEHELGHTFGLIHCQNADCVIRSSTYMEDIDQKSHLCNRCRLKLI